LIMKLV